MASTEEKKVWKDKEILNFIQIYRTLPELWDTHSLDYKDRVKKIEGLNKLAQVFNTSVEEVRRKLHNLRCQFSAEMRKIKRKSIEHGIDDSVIYSEWKFFDDLKFLIGICNAAERKPDVIISDMQSSSPSDDSEDGLEDAFITKAEPETSRTEKVYVSTSDFNNGPSISTSDDDNRIFGEYIASELRNLSDRNAKRLKLMIRKAILEVTEDEYNNLDN